MSLKRLARVASIFFWSCFAIVALIVLIVIFSCSSPSEPEVITITVTDTFYTAASNPQISSNPIAIGRWEDGNLLAFLAGNGVNISDEIIEDVSVDFTLTSERDRTGILSETTGYFLIERPAVAKYVPNDPFPYEIQYNLSPDSTYSMYVGADTLRNIDRAYWWFRIGVGENLSKRVLDWKYGGEIGSSLNSNLILNGWVFGDGYSWCCNEEGVRFDGGKINGIDEDSSW